MTAPAASHRRILFASLVGTSVEFYDFYIYATAAALVFGPLFFPAQEPRLRRWASYASFSVAFFARPLGGLVFGHFGDRLGRKSTLVASLMLMGLSTVLIAFLPTYAMIGWVAPTAAVLAALRPGAGAGRRMGRGEPARGRECAAGWANRYGSFPPMGAPVGFIFANGFFLLLGALLTDEQFREWGWRLPFLASAGWSPRAVGAAQAHRDAPPSSKAARSRAAAAVPIGELLRDHWLPTMAGTIGTSPASRSSTSRQCS
jgi:MFS family permease